MCTTIAHIECLKAFHATSFLFSQFTILSCFSWFVFPQWECKRHFISLPEEMAVFRCFYEFAQNEIQYRKYYYILIQSIATLRWFAVSRQKLCVRFWLTFNFQSHDLIFFSTNFISVISTKYPSKIKQPLNIKTIVMKLKLWYKQQRGAKCVCYCSKIVRNEFYIIWQLSLRRLA